MQEIWVPELIIALFLVLPIVRPFSKKLFPLGGVDWLPVPAFLIALAMIPAYGLRPETFPLSICAAALFGRCVFRGAGGRAGFGKHRDANLFFAAPVLVLLAASAGLAFCFAPLKDTDLLAEGVYTFTVLPDSAEAGSGKGAEKERFIRVYAAEGQSSRRPLLIALPPALGSLPAVDRVCGELRDRGFTVLSYSRRGFDSPAVSVSPELSPAAPASGRAKRYGVGPAEWLRRARAFLSGTLSAKANAWGRGLEESRKEDIRFLLSWIRKNPRVSEQADLFDIASPDAVFLAGWDAAGSALALLGNSPPGGDFSPHGGFLPSGEFFPAAIRIRGLVAIESPLWSLYREEAAEVTELPLGNGWFRAARQGLKLWFLEIRPQKMAGLREIPALSPPVLFLVSDKSREPKYRDSRYRALTECFRAARGPALMVSADGAGPLDYSDLPIRHPLAAALFSGREKPAWNNGDAPGNTASIIVHFAAGVLETPEGAPRVFGDVKLPAGLRIERRN